MEERTPDKIIILNCASETQNNSHILHIFKAKQWKDKFRVGKRNMYPLPPGRYPGWWRNYYRIMLNRSWYTDGKAKYRFYTQTELLQIIAQLLSE